MPLFKYKAAEKNGKTMEVLIEGDSRADSLTRLRQRGFTPIQFIGQMDGDQGTTRAFWQRGFDPLEFTNRLVPLLKSHIPLERALGIIADTTDNAHAKTIINDLRRGLHEGKKFSTLIRDRGNYFPPIFANMVEAGEESGSLPEVIIELRRFLSERKELRDFLITSSIYPLIVLMVTSGVIILLFAVFIPQFSKIFIDMGKKPPLPTEIMIGISYLVTEFWWLWLLLFAGGCLFLHQVRRGGKARGWWDENVLKLPLLGKLIQLIEVTRFIRTLAVLIQNYVHLLDTVKIAGRVFQNSVIRQSIAGVATELRGGSRLSVALSKSPYIPKTVIQMLNIGEETGNVGGMLQDVADSYEETVRKQIRRVLALFEPVVIMFLAIIVFFVVSSIFLAILEIQKL